MKSVGVIKSQARNKINYFFVLAAVAWTALMAGLFYIYYNNEYEAAVASARSAAISSTQRDLVYRKWNSGHGGIYVPVTEQTPPNPHLAHLPERDIEGPAGKKLTLMNPSYVNRQLYESGMKGSGLYTRITSMNPLRTENAPDEWERKALLGLQGGDAEYFGFDTVNGSKRFRHMTPIFVEPSCIKCHIHQGYKVGDLAGGITVSVPWEEYYASLIEKSRTMLVMYSFIWLFGLTGILGTRSIVTSQMGQQEIALDTLAKTERTLNTVLQATSAGIGLIRDRVIQWTNDGLTEITGYTQEDMYLKPSKNFYESEAEYERVGSLMYNEISKTGKSTIETRFLRKDGSFVDVLMNLTAIDMNDISAGAVFALLDISESKRMARKLEEHVASMERAELAAKFGNWELDLKTGKIRGSNGARHIYGLQQNEMDLETAQKVPLPEYRPKLDQALSELIKDRTPYDIEFKTLRQSDSKIVDIHSMAYFDPNANLIFGVIQDITRQKQAEEALVQSEAKYRMLTENMSDVIWSSSPTLELDYASPSIKALLGYEPEELFGKLFFDFLTTESRERMQPVLAGRLGFAKSHKSLPRFSYEVEMIRKDSSRVWVEIVSNAVTDSEGNLLGFQGLARDVTERKEVEEALKESEILYRTLFECALESIIIIDMEGEATGRIISANPVAAKIHGYPLDEFTTLRLADLETEDSAQGLENRIKAVLSGELLRNQINHRRKDGTVFPIEISANLIEIRGHKYCIGIDRDISERKMAEDALRQSESKFRSYVESSPVGILETDSEGRLLSANNACSSISGYPNQALLQMGIFDFIPLDSLSENLAHFQRLILSGDVSADVQVMTAGGDTIWESVHAVKLPDNRFLFFVMDITDRKKAEEELTRAKDETLQLINRMTNGFVIFESVFDGEGKFVTYRHLFTNDAFESITGLKLENIRGKTIHEVCPGTEQEWIDYCGEVATTGKPRSFELYHAPSEKLFYCNVYRPWESTDRFCMILEDVTERRRAQAEIIEMEKKLLQSQKLESLGVLSGGIAHDFNNLLAVIIGNIELAQDSYFNPSDKEIFLERAMSASTKSARLVRQMLDYSGKGAFEINEVNLSELVEDNVEMYRTTVPKNIRLNIDRSEDDIFIKADSSQIQQVIMNLIINASEALARDHGAIDIATGAKYCDESILSGSLLPEKLNPQEMAFIRVSDDGAGMELETVDRIFDPFFSTKFVGRGLGMSVVHGVVRGHHGAVTIESQPDSGTIITVYLPLFCHRSPAHAGSGDAQICTPSTEGACAETTNFSVMVVDDEPEVLNLVVKQLEYLGCQTLSAANGKEALEVFSKNNDVDLVILDLLMPQMGGVETFHRLMELNPELKIVVCSGYKEEHTREEFKTEWKPVAFLEKPYRYSALKDLIKRFRDKIETN